MSDEVPIQVSLGRRLGRSLLSLDVLPILVSMAGLLFFFGLYEPRFFRVINLVNVLRNSSYLVIIASGQMLALVVGGFDLSVGSVVALSSVTTALAMVQMTHVTPDHVALILAIGITAGLAAGSAIGVINGLCVASLRVSPFVVTLGTMSLASGIALYTTSGVPVHGMPNAFTHGFGRIRWFNLPVSIYVTILVVVLIWCMMNWTKLGRYMYAIGGNIHAARVSGIRVDLCTIVAYTMCSSLAALTGVLLTARVGTGEGTMGGTYMLESIAAAVLGGVQIGGGVGRVEFVVIGAVFLALVTNSMNIMRVDSKIQMIVIGVLLILAVALGRLRKKDMME